MEIGEFGVGRPDFGGRWPRGEALGKKKLKGLLEYGASCATALVAVGWGVGTGSTGGGAFRGE